MPRVINWLFMVANKLTQLRLLPIQKQLQKVYAWGRSDRTDWTDPADNGAAGWIGGGVFLLPHSPSGGQRWGEERDEVKKVAKQLLERLKALLVLDWRKRQSARARVEDAIKGLLDDGLPRAYTPELYQQKCSTLFEHFFESYPETGMGVYGMAG
jgi:hypothetical protein